MLNRYFILKDFDLSSDLKTQIIKINKERFRFYGTRRKRLYMHSLNLEVMPSLQEVLDKLVDPEIVDNYEIMYTEPGAVVMPHTDSRRKVALNIPIEGNFDESYVGIFDKGKTFIPNTEFFEGKPVLKDGGGWPDSTLIKKVNYTTPICLNTEEVHNVVNFSKTDRVVLGLGFNPKLSFADIERMQEIGKFVHAKYCL
jgi:hypothetical protein